MLNIYGKYAPTLDKILNQLMNRFDELNNNYQKVHHERLYEHLNGRVKSEASMEEKCTRKHLLLTAHSALREVRDSIGLRVVCNFIDDIYTCIDYIKSWDDVSVYNEKDYITNAKTNGYRSYHMILEITVPDEDVDGNIPGHYFVEVQLRTIAMDTWASLEHEMKYKHQIKNPEMIGKELKRVADELASCDVSMQTIRQLIKEVDQLMKILVAEDEPQLLRVLTVAMEKSGYEVDPVDNGLKAVEHAKANSYDVIILDIMMPIMDGITALKKIRESGDKTYILMLTAKAEVDDRVTGLDSGADDYITKPFSLKELLARLRSKERREDDYTPNLLTVGDVTLNVEQQNLASHNSIQLSGPETQLMNYFFAK